MSALATERSTETAGPEYSPRLPKGAKVKGGVKIFKGSLIVLDAGYAKPAVTATGLLCAGLALQTVDNTSGSDGDLTVEQAFVVAKFANGDSIAQADVGAAAYATDDQTVAKTSTGKSKIGTIYGVDSDGVWVKLALTA